MNTVTAALITTVALGLAACLPTAKDCPDGYTYYPCGDGGLPPSPPDEPTDLSRPGAVDLARRTCSDDLALVDACWAAFSGEKDQKVRRVGRMNCAGDVLARVEGGWGSPLGKLVTCVNFNCAITTSPSAPCADPTCNSGAASCCDLLAECR